MSNIDSQKTESTIYIDIGNSAIKVGYKSEGNWIVHKYITAVETAYQVNNHTYQVNKIIISSVRKSLMEAFEKEVEAHLLEELTVNNIDKKFLEYETPETLGLDRYLACLGAKAYSDKAIIVIDAGSACTIDLMDENAVFKGGVIMPGLSAILNIFKKTAPELPEIGLNFPHHFPGKNTKESLELGQVVFYTDGIKKMLERYSNLIGIYDLFITGGDSKPVNKLIGGIGTIKKDLVFDGMEKLALTKK